MVNFIQIDYFNHLFDESLATDKVSAFIDVKEKGRRILESGKYTVYKQSTYSILADVQGDTGTYSVYVNRNVKVNDYEKNDIAYWDCTCEWANWAFNREYYYGRMCSHAYAMYTLLRRSREASMDEPISPRDTLQDIVVDLCMNNFDEASNFVLEGIAPESFSKELTEISERFEIPADAMSSLVKDGLIQATNNIIEETAKNIGIVTEEVNAIESQSEAIGMALDEVITERAELSTDLLEAQKLKVELKGDDITPKQASQVIDSIFKKLDSPKVKRAKKTAGRIFTEEEKLALINEAGLSRQFLAKEIQF